jgi:hypothetical protein
MVEVSRSDSDERLLEVIEYWRTHEVERKERAERGRRFVRERFSTQAYLDNMLRYADMFLEGQRGIHINHEVQCHYHDVPEEGQPAGTSDREASVYADLRSMPAVVNDAPLRRG